MGFDPSVVSHIAWFLVRPLLVKLSRSVRSPFVGFVSVVDKSFVSCRQLSTSVERRLFYVSVPAAPESVTENSLYCRLSKEQSPTQCCGLSVDDVQQCDCWHHH